MIARVLGAVLVLATMTVGIHVVLMAAATLILVTVAVLAWAVFEARVRNSGHAVPYGGRHAR